MWSPLADRPPRSVAPAATSSGHQSARLGALPALHLHQFLTMRKVLLATCALALGCASTHSSTGSSAATPSSKSQGGVRLTTDGSQTRGCKLIGDVPPDEMPMEVPTIVQETHRLQNEAARMGAKLKRV